MSKQTQKEGGDSFVRKLSRFIVEKRNLIFLIYAVLMIFSVFSRGWVKVENALDTYLPDDSETEQGLDVMDTQFTTFGTAQIMFSSVSLDEAEAIEEEIKNMEGVQGVEFDDTTDHYSDVSALYSVTFDYSEDDERCLDVLNRLEETYSNYDIYVSTDLGNAEAETLENMIWAVPKVVN